MGTPGARLAGQVPQDVVAGRFAGVMELARRISREKCRSRIGETAIVLVDEKVSAEDSAAAGFEGSLREKVRFVGRSQREAYDVDGVVYLAGDFTPGELAKVQIVDSSDYDLVGAALPSAH